jgi:hypothetical protein
MWPHAPQPPAADGAPCVATIARALRHRVCRLASRRVTDNLYDADTHLRALPRFEQIFATHGVFGRGREKMLFEASSAMPYEHLVSSGVERVFIGGKRFFQAGIRVRFLSAQCEPSEEN